jgi:D-alanyl-D-alanine carboxypeptidase/D-alanyl-D-alanine-endopeptidase (penicillin-binding protein 4)
MNTGQCISVRGLLIAGSLLLSACANVPKAESTQTLESVLADPALDGVISSLTVRDANSGATLFQHNGNTRLLPASSLKLLTAAAAMDVLGADYRFTTQLLSNGQQLGDRLNGNLYLRGFGDPSIQAQDYRQLALALAHLGIKSVSGDLVIDDTAFDTRRLGVDWAHDDEEKYYGAQISALSLSPNDDFDAGTVIVTVNAPAIDGEPTLVSISPQNRTLTLLNRAMVGPTNSITVNRDHGSNQLTVSGTLMSGTQSRKWVSVWEPTRLVADVFRQALAEQGIEIRGQILIGGVTAPGAIVLVSHESPPLAQLLLPLLKLSNNSIAEVLLKAMGRKTANAGTASAGVAAVNGFLARQGIDTELLVQVDGSGLSRRNLISTQSLTDVLLAVRKQPWFDSWHAALPIAGNPQRMLGGTLRNRLRNTPAENNLHAKTGSMGSVSSLSGYVSSANGRSLVFAMVSNNYLVDGARIKMLEDKVAVALAQWVN